MPGGTSSDLMRCFAVSLIELFPELQVLQSLDDEGIRVMCESQAAQAQAQDKLPPGSAPVTEAAHSAAAKQVLGCALCTCHASS